MNKIGRGDYRSILKLHQIAILREFFSDPQAEGYFLTGGTALSAFYLHHRYSKDLDFFKIGEFDTFFIERFVQSLTVKFNCHANNKVKSPTYCEYYLENEREGWIQRLDFVKEQPIRFGDLHNQDSIVYDDLVNIATNKICAIYGRLEPKDYIDLYLIVKELGMDFNQLFDLAKQKTI